MLNSQSDANTNKYLALKENHLPMDENLNKYAATISYIPFHVLIVYSDLYCSGVLLRSNIVLTAASCFHLRKNDQTIVKVGVNSIISIGQIINVTEIKLHEYYGHKNARDNDIALLVLQQHVNFDKNVKKAILIQPNTVLQSGLKLDVSGYAGENVNSKYATRLLWSEMNVMSKSECFDTYKDLMTSSNFCARYQSDRRLSDNGGPALFKGLLVGIVSFGATSSKRNVAMLTNVTYFHSWIILNTKRFLDKYCVPDYDMSYYELSEEYGAQHLQ